MNLWVLLYRQGQNKDVHSLGVSPKNCFESRYSSEIFDIDRVPGKDLFQWGAYPARGRIQISLIRLGTILFSVERMMHESDVM